MSNTIKSGSSNDIMNVNTDKEALVALNQDITYQFIYSWE